MLIEINPYNINRRSIEEVVHSLRKGNIIIFPTDSVYNVGCDLFNKKALQELARFKDVKLNKARFSIICSDLSDISNYTKPIDRPTFKLLKHHLPGPFTFILNATNEVQKIFDSNRKKIGIRIPDNNILKAITEELGNPLATTSLHDEEDHILDYFTDPNEMYQRYEDQVSIVIDGGTGHLEPTTVVDCTEGDAKIIRQGAGKLDL
ncbi:MAG: translation factor [Crocinitomicaceae bacterium]|jgi:tRNA threonylcarbamoyl adenosine modification protein (Sua5/YciO/YrdC/YwlC family)|nr:translation factor [Crocinitomicaceae bacterium]